MGKGIRLDERFSLAGLGMSGLLLGHLNWSHSCIAHLMREACSIWLCTLSSALGTHCPRPSSLLFISLLQVSDFSLECLFLLPLPLSFELSYPALYIFDAPSPLALLLCLRH